MKKLLISIGLLDLCFHYPLLSSLGLLIFITLEHLSDSEKLYLQELTMTIFSNAKEFSHYLKEKARQLDIPLPTLRKQVVDNLETDTNEISPETTNQNNLKDSIDSILSDNLSAEELESIKASEALQEQILRVVKEATHVPEKVWRTASLADMYAEDLDDDYEDNFKRWNVKVDFTKTFTEKDFRILKSKLKALGRNESNEIIDSELQHSALLELNSIYSYFTGQKFNCFDLKIT